MAALPLEQSSECSEPRSATASLAAEDEGACLVCGEPCPWTSQTCYNCHYEVPLGFYRCCDSEPRRCAPAAPAPAVTFRGSAVSAEEFRRRAGAIKAALAAVDVSACSLEALADILGEKIVGAAHPRG